MTGDFRQDRVGSALQGRNPMVLRRLSAGFAVIGDNQHLPGYCVLICDDPRANHLTDLPPQKQLVFLEDMAILGRAVSAVCARRDPTFRRVNLEIQGNTDAFLHAHVTPRFGWEPADIVGWPMALHAWSGQVIDAPALDDQFKDLRDELTNELDRQVKLRSLGA